MKDEINLHKLVKLLFKSDMYFSRYQQIQLLDLCSKMILKAAEVFSVCCAVVGNVKFVKF